MRLVFALSFAATLFGQQQIGGFVRVNGGVPIKPVPSDCSVDGFVVNAITGEPVARAQVTLVGPGGAARVSADSSGRWRFTNASCGAVQVSAQRPGFLPGNSAQPQMGSFFRPTLVSSDSPLRDVKIQLTPQAVVTGKVLDDQGDPIQNAMVTAFTSRVVQGRRTFQQSASNNTNDLGEFRLSGLQGGRYILCAHGAMAPPSVEGTLSGESCYPGPIEEGGAASAMDLSSGRDARLDFTLPRVSAVHIRGVVTGLPPGGGVGMALARRDAGRGGPVSHQAIVRPDGRFEVAGVPPGSYMLNCDYFEAGKRLTARVPVDVGSSDVEGVSVHLDQGLSVTGTVRYESQSGAVPSGQFNMNFHPADPMLGGGSIQWNKDHTTFTVPDLPPGAYRIDGFVPPPFYLKSAMLGGHDISREEVQLGQSAGPVDVILSDDSGGIDGQVVGSDDQPITGACWVMVLQNGRPPQNFMSGPGGQFKARALAPGEYRVYAWDDIQQVEYENPDWMKHFAAMTVTVDSGQNAQVKLTRSTLKSN